MLNWCANRIKLTMSAYAQTEVEAGRTGRCIRITKAPLIKVFACSSTGVAGRLKLGIDMLYPALTAHGSDEPTEAALAFDGWVAKLGSNAWLDKSCCHYIDQHYQATGLAGLK